MDFINVQDISENGLIAKKYYTDGPIGIDDIIDILSSYVDDETTMYECKCRTFTEDGFTRIKVFTKIDELSNMYNFPNPSIGVRALFIDRNTGEYKFNITTAVNTNVIEYSISDRAKLYLKKCMELERMESEAAEKRREEEQKTKR